MDQKWIVIIHKVEKPKFRVFAFCNGGAGASIYLQWKAFIPNDIEFCAIQLPGREFRCEESLMVEMKSVINGISDALMDYQDVPFIFFGHSIGALIAFETTRELRRRKTKLPLALFLAGYTPPDEVVRPPIYQLPQNEFIAAIAKYYEPIPSNNLKHQKFLDLYLNILKADTQIADTYTYVDEKPLDIPLWIFGGINDPLAHDKSLAGWSKHTTKAFTLKMYPGSHFFINNIRKEVCELMINELNKLQNMS